MDDKIQNQIRNLKLYNGFLTLIILSFFIMSFGEYQKKRFEEISVERINIIEKNGSIKMVIANKKLLPPVTLNGKTVSKNPKMNRGPGMLFYNDEGDEIGGYLFGGGNGEGNYGHISMDQYKQDQVIRMKYSEQMDGNERLTSAGILVQGQPTNINSDRVVAFYDSIATISDKDLKRKLSKEFKSRLEASNSLFVGKSQDNAYGLFLTDKNNKERLNLYVDKEGKPRLEFLDSTGKVFYTLPDK
jgi:hypothetical protein